MEKILIIKGTCDGIKIYNSAFTLLKPLEEHRGYVRATVDASRLFGDAYKIATVDVEDFKLL